ncbi:MAG: carboxypeptidase-like regulatory domain-containing protein [Candidatus Bathyarchaeota archaeon]
MKRAVYLIVLFFLQLTVLVTVFSAQEQRITYAVSNNVYNERGFFEPYMVVTDKSYIYVTSFGNYSFDKKLSYIMSFTFFDGSELVSNSFFYINTSLGIPILINQNIVIANDSVFQVRVDVVRTFKVATLTITHRFFKDVKPKISVSLSKTEKWNLGDFTICWLIFSRTHQHVMLNSTHAKDIKEFTTLKVLRERVKYIEFGVDENPMNWKTWCMATWDDYGEAEVYSGNYELFGFKGSFIQVRFKLNDEDIDPSIVAQTSVSSSTQFASQRKNFYANGRHWVLFTSSTDYLFSSSLDGSAWEPPRTLREEPSMGASVSVRYFTSVSKTVNGLSGYWLSTEQGTSAMYVRKTLSSLYESQYVDSLDDTYLQWNTYGISPYLNNINDESYIYTSTNNLKHGNFGFSNFTGSGQISRVEIGFCARKGSESDVVGLYCAVYDGVTWSDIFFACNVTYTFFIWYYRDITNIPNSWTWTELNNAKMYVLSYVSSGTIYVDACFIRATYTPTSADWGIRLWRRSKDGTEVEIDEASGYKMIVTRNQSGEGYQSSSWTASSSVSFVGTDSLVVRVYVRIPSLTGSWYELATFTTKRLECTGLVNSTWTVYYYTYFSNSEVRFYFGSSEYNSRIENFQIDPIPIYGYQLSSFFNGTHLHIAIARGALLCGNVHILYRCGVPRSDGTIDFYDEFIAVEGFSGVYRVCNIAVDSNGCPYISYHVGGSYLNVTKSYSNNGSWNTAYGYPVRISSFTSLGAINSIVVPLSNLKMFVLYGSSYIYGRAFNGTAWLNEVSTGLRMQNFAYVSAVAYNDVVHVVFLEYSYYDIEYINYSYSTNSWSPTFTVQATVSSSSAPVLSVDESGTLYCFWTVSGVLYYKRCINGYWDTEPTAWFSEVDITANDVLTCFYRSSGSTSTYYIGLEYLKGATSPYYIKYAFLTITVSNPPSIGEFASPVIVYANKFFLFNVTVNDLDGVNDLVNVTVEFSNNVILKWENTSSFSKHYDPYNYCTLDSSNSFKTSLNSTAYMLSWRIKLSWNYPEGYVSIVSENTKVFDRNGCYGSSSHVNLFVFEDDLIVADTNVDDGRINPNQLITITGTLYYEGTTIPPEDASGITVKVDLGNINKGSTTVIDRNGLFSISFTGESSVGLYSYTVYAVTDQNTVQNQTVNVIVDRIMVVSYSVSKYRVNINENVDVNVTLEYEYDGNAVTTGTININGYPAVYMGSGVYRIMRSCSTVTSETYNDVSGSESMYGLNVVNQNGKSVTVVWDRIKVENSGVTKERVNIGVAVTVYFVLKYEYDNMLVNDGFVLVNSSFANYNSDHGRWEINVCENSVVKHSYYVSSVSGNIHGITVVNHVAPYPSVIWDYNEIVDFKFSSGTIFNLTVKVNSLYDGPLINKTVKLRIYLNNSLWQEIEAITNSSGYLSVQSTKNIYGNCTLTFNCSRIDYEIDSYSYSFDVSVKVLDIEVFSMDPVIVYSGNYMTIIMKYLPKAKINDTYVPLSNVYWKALIYAGDKYYGFFNFPLYNGTFANDYETKTLSFPCALSEGSYKLNMTFYIRGSDVLLGSVETPYFIVKKKEAGGAVGSIVYTYPLTVIVRDSKGLYVSGASVTIIDIYNATVYSGKTDAWGTVIVQLGPGTYNVTVKYDDTVLTETVTISNEPITKTFSLPSLTVTPITVVLDSYSVLWMFFALLGAIGSVVIERRGYTFIAVLLGLFTVGSLLHAVLVITHRTPPLFTVPSFDELLKLPSVSLPSLSLDLSFLSLSFENAVLIVACFAVMFSSIYYITHRKPTYKPRTVRRRVR